MGCEMGLFVSDVVGGNGNGAFCSPLPPSHGRGRGRGTISQMGGEGRMTSITHLGFAIRLPLTVSRFSVFLIPIALLDSNERASEQNELLFYLMMPPQHLSWRDVCPASLKYFQESQMLLTSQKGLSIKLPKRTVF